jgi:hypothetical protein
MINPTAPIIELSSKYQAEKYVYLPQMVPCEQSIAYELQTRKLAARRVVCGIKEISWDEQQIPESNELFQFFRSDPVLSLIRACIASQASLINYKMVCWTSRYSTNEYINPHRDAAGTIQLLLCLASCPQENGGVLMLKPDKGDSLSFCLTPGDALLFRATEIQHWTTPLRPSDNYPNPSRVVAVARYFF